VTWRLFVQLNAWISKNHPAAALTVSKSSERNTHTHARTHVHVFGVSLLSLMVSDPVTQATPGVDVTQGVGVITHSWCHHSLVVSLSLMVSDPVTSILTLRARIRQRLSAWDCGPSISVAISLNCRG